MTYLPGVTSEIYMAGYGWATIVNTSPHRGVLRPNLGPCCLCEYDLGRWRTGPRISPLYRWYRRYAW